MEAPKSRDEAPDRVDRRKAETRQHLLAAARRLLIRSGYHAVRPQDIAREADVGYGTFYLHFADKRECFLACVDAAQVELDALVRDRLLAAHQAGIRGVEAFFAIVLNAILDYAEMNPGVLVTAMTEPRIIAADGAKEAGLIGTWAKNWSRVIAAGIPSGVFYADYDAAVVGHAIVGIIRGASIAGGPREGRVQTMVRMLVRALVPDPDGRAAREFEPLGLE